MKHLKLMLLLLMIQAVSMGQPNTGMTYYSHGSTAPMLTSGTYVSTDPGFIMAGCRSSVASGPNLVIDKVDVDGLFNASTGEFAKQYTITTGGVNCNVSQNQEVDCAGISLIETFQGSNQYALTAAFNSGCLIAFLNNSGNVTSINFFPFPSSQTLGSFTKPLITESANNPGYYYIVGQYLDNGRDYMYVIKTDINFTTGWSSTYHLGASTYFKAYGIVESNFNVSTGELVVVGMCDLGGATSEDAFLLALDDNSSGVVNFAHRYYSTTGGDLDHFSSVHLANNNSGYIVGGNTTDASNPGYAWMARMTATGAYNWMKQIEFASDVNAGDVVGVLERYSSGASSHFYYGLSTSVSGGMLVAKMTSSGAAVAGSSEFWYNSTLGVDQSATISYENTASGLNEGIHCFGNTNAFPNNQFYLVQACFNGVSGNMTQPTYQYTTGLNTVSSGPTGSTALTVSAISPLNSCIYYGISNANISTSATHLPNYKFGVLPNSPYVGSNAKSTNMTGYTENSGGLVPEINVYPNPATDMLIVRIPKLEQGGLELEIQNFLGQVVLRKKCPNDYKASNDLEMEISTQNLKSGVYLLRISVGEEFRETKFVVDRE